MKKDIKIQRRQNDSIGEKEKGGTTQKTKDAAVTADKRAQRQGTERIGKSEGEETEGRGEKVSGKKEIWGSVILTDDEKRILMVLNLLSGREVGLRVTGFQALNFLETMFPGKQVDELYAELHKKRLVTNPKEEFRITDQGSNEIERCQPLQEAVLDLLAETAKGFLTANELLRRALYLAYSDQWKLGSYISKLGDELNERERVLIAILSNAEFPTTPIITAIVRKQPKLIKEKLQELCKEADFLKVLAVLRLDDIKDRIGIKTVGSIHYGSCCDLAAEIVEKANIEDILRKLSLLGITESENLFDINIGHVLKAKENIGRLKDWLVFDNNRFKEQLETDWNSFLSMKEAMEGSRPSNVGELIRIKVLLPCKDRLLIRQEATVLYEQTYLNIQHKLKEKLQRVDNVVILPFYQTEQKELGELKGRIIVALQVENWWAQKHRYPSISENELEKNIVLFVSPREIGFGEEKKEVLPGDRLRLADTNVEFNAISEFENLDEVKSHFGTCKWVSEEEHYSVQEAKRKIWEKENPPISLEEAVNKLKKGYKEIEGRILVNALLIAVNKPTLYSPIFKNRTFGRDDIDNNLVNVLSLKYALSKDRIETVIRRLRQVMETEARMDLLTLGLEGIPGSKIYYSERTRILIQVAENYDVKKDIISTLEHFDEKSKRIVWTYLRFFMNSNWRLNDFRACYNSIFDEHISEEAIVDSILKSGATVVARRNDWLSEYPFPYVRTFLPELLSVVEKSITWYEPDMTEFREKHQENIIELIGLDYLLTTSKCTCQRQELRDFLWTISPDAWNRFESYKGLISSKDNEVISLNPLIIRQLTEFVSSSKRSAVKYYEKLKAAMLSMRPPDYEIRFDEESGIYTGFIMTPEKEKVAVIVASWYLPSYDKYFGDKTLLVITGQEDHRTFIEAIKIRPEKITVFLFENQSFSVYSSFDRYDFVRLLITGIQQLGYKAKTKEFEFEELEVSPKEGAEGVATDKVTGLGEPSVLDEIFPASSRKTLSSLFITASYGPRCILLIGSQKQGKKMIEDLAKEDLKYWGNYTPRLKQIDTVKEDEDGKTTGNGGFGGDVSKAVQIISDPEIRVISINISREYAGWIATIIERLKEVETQGLKYVILSFKEILPQKILAQMIGGIQEQTSVQTCILEFPSNKEVREVREKICGLFGKEIELPLGPHENLNAVWNSLQKEMREVTLIRRAQIDRDEELHDITLLHNETVDHYVMRSLACKYLREHGYSVSVESPEQTDDGKIVPDLTAEKKGETFFVEAETCVPSAKEKEAYHSKVIDPYKRLLDKMNKYKGKEGNHLMLMIPNIFALIHRDLLKSLAEYSRSKLKMKVSVHTIGWTSYPPSLLRIL